MHCFIVFVFIIGTAGGVYQDTSYPYGMGPLTVDIHIYNPDIIEEDPPPMHTKVYYPIEADDYVVYYYVTGFGGLTPPSLYDDVNTQIASHGYVVFATWPLLGDEGVSIEVATHVENIAWLEEHAWKDLGGSMPVFDSTAFGCHSAGCGINLKLANNQSDIAAGLINLEPNNWSIYENEPDYYLPSFNMGSNLSMWDCTQPGLNFEAWYDVLNCPKILVESANQGHCDFVDYEDWADCEALCAGGPEESLDHYRETVGGMVTAFMNTYSQGNKDYLHYVAEEEEIPIELTQHGADIHC